MFMQGFPETLQLFQGFFQGKNIEKGCSKLQDYKITEFRELSSASAFR
jgi:hypothetical protein